MSTKEYGLKTAFHYAAYRPPLHAKILSVALPGNSKFAFGLDVGSGTGYSSIALKQYCEFVFGVDPSDEMREQATAHPSIQYLSGSGESIPLDNSCADIITLAGSLSYTNKPIAAKEFCRVAKPNATIVVYDFEVLLAPVLANLGVDLEPTSSDYNHSENLSGTEGLEEVAVCSDKLCLALTPQQLAHTVLSSEVYYLSLRDKLGEKDLYERLVEKLTGTNSFRSIDAKIYYSVYLFNP